VIINGLADSYNLDGELTFEDTEELYEELISQINSYQLTIQSPASKLTKETYGIIAQFVNLDSRKVWRKDKLIIAYNCIMSFDPTNISPPYRFEHRSNKYPSAVDPVACYLICRHHQIKLNRETTYVEMTSLIRLLTMTRIERGMIGSDLTNHSLIKHLTEETHQVSYDNIVHPLVKNNYEAICHAITNWKIDISLSEYPMIDYYANYGKSQFRPFTFSLVNICKVNPFRLKFGTYFNRELPLKYYNVEILRKFYVIEGVDHNPQTLIERSIYNTFHHLLQPEVKETETSFLKDSIDEVSPVELISYGVMSCSYSEYTTNTMKIYTLEELAAMFKAQKNFVDSISGELFNSDAIIKLSNICIGLSGNNKISAETKRKALDLKNAIEMVNIRQRGLNDRIKQWVERVEQSKSGNSVIETLTALLEAGMYLRAWRGPPHPYPILKSEVDNQQRVERDSTLALIKFNELNNSLADGLKVDSLPLTKYFKGHFVESDSKYEGYTINDRIEIINKGDNVREMSSCIRLSSNFIIASAYRYLQILGHQPSFSINTMIDVS
jgi:hypothetical protein